MITAIVAPDCGRRLLELCHITRNVYEALAAVVYKITLVTLNCGQRLVYVSCQLRPTLRTRFLSTAANASLTCTTSQETCEDIKRVIHMTIAIVMINCDQRLLELCHITRNVYIYDKRPVKTSNELYI